MMSLDGLNGIFRGKAKWQLQRDVMSRTNIVSFQCERLTPVLHISDNAIEDADVRVFASQCIDMYTRHHAVYGHAVEMQPTLTCRECRSPVDVPSESEYDYEFCERQAVLWMERAARVRR